VHNQLIQFPYQYRIATPYACL